MMSIPSIHALSQVYKTGVTHYFNINKSRSHFGYDPQPRDLSGVVRWYTERGRGWQGDRRDSRWYTVMKTVCVLSLFVLVLTVYL